MKFDSVLVTAVVPAHNCEKTICACVDSLLGQSYGNIEIVVVENGSTDRTASTIQEQYGRQQEVVVLPLEEANVARARKAGVERARGDLIAFCDSDDWYQKDAIQILATKLQQQNADIVNCGYAKAISPGIPLRFPRSFVEADTVLKKSEWSYSDYVKPYNPLRYPFFSGLCGSLYKRSVLQAVPEDVLDNGLRRGEDILVNSYAQLMASKVLTIPDMLYRYRVGGVTSKNERLLEDLFKLKEELDRYYAPHIPCSQTDLDAESASYILNIIFRRYQSAYAVSKRDVVLFYEQALHDVRVRGLAKMLLDSDPEEDDVLIAKLFLQDDPEWLACNAKKRYAAKRYTLKALAGISRLFR